MEELYTIEYVVEKMCESQYEGNSNRMYFIDGRGRFGADAKYGDT